MIQNENVDSASCQLYVNSASSILVIWNEHAKCCALRISMLVLLTLLLQSANWMCPSCVQEVKLEEEKYSVKSSAFHSSLPPRSTTIKDSLTLGSGGCNCNACVAKR